jgi:fucose 4-O-acetylase-like acetyltransferase
MAKEPAARKIIPGNLLGFKCSGPALLMHPQERLLELVWGKASFHLYFLVVLLGLIACLPPAVSYLKWRKAGFIEALVASCLVQAWIFILQHNYLKLQFPASTILWYAGSLVPGAWIGLNWEEFRSRPYRFVLPLATLSLLSGYLFFKGEVGVFLGIPEENYPTLGSQAMYTSCMAILALSVSLSLTAIPLATRLLKPIGTHSLQIYLIHPIFIVLLERPLITRVLNATYMGAILSPVLMFAATLATTAVIRRVRLEKFLFGR